MDKYEIRFPREDLERIARKSFVASMGLAEYAEFMLCSESGSIISPRKFYGMDDVIDSFEYFQETEKMVKDGKVHINTFEAFTASLYAFPFFRFDKTEISNFHEVYNGIVRETTNLVAKSGLPLLQTQLMRLKMRAEGIMTGGSVSIIHSHPAEEGFSEGDMKGKIPIYLLKCPSSWYSIGCDAYDTEKLDSEQIVHAFSSAICYARENIRELPRILQKYEQLLMENPEIMKYAAALTAGMGPSEAWKIGFDPQSAEPEKIRKAGENYMKNLFETPDRHLSFFDPKNPQAKCTFLIDD